VTSAPTGTWPAEDLCSMRDAVLQQIPTLTSRCMILMFVTAGDSRFILVDETHVKVATLAAVAESPR
jgi:hypothetical protein